MIDEKLPNWPKNIELGFRAGMPLLEVKLTTTSEEGHNIKPEWYTKLVNVLGDHFIAKIENTPLSLAKNILLKLTDNNFKITTAESCTGGLIASLLTKEAGASTCFEAGFVTYSNHMKTQLLDVSNKLLEQHGAVSEEVVISMAKGALAKSTADFVIAVSGIAGPAGGSIEKPVGTVWIAWGHKDNLKTVGLLMPLPRSYFQKYVANIGLDLVRRELISSTQTAHYMIERKFS
jgi:nicotinamide-nucleotide amidase